MLKFSRPPMAHEWGDANNSQLSIGIDNLSEKVHKFRIRNVSDSSIEDIEYLPQCQNSQMHSINENSPRYPKYLRKARDVAIVLPPRSNWVPLHPKSKWPNWKKLLKKKEDEIISTPVKQVKTGWVLPGMELKRSVTSGFSFNRKNRDVQTTISETETDLDSENSNTIIGSTCSLPKRIDSNLGCIRYSNYYMRGEDGYWIFVHRDQNGRVIGQYEIKESCI